MKRSEVNEILARAKKVLVKHQIVLPPFGYWSPEDWVSKGPECDEIRECGPAAMATRPVSAGPSRTARS